MQTNREDRGNGYREIILPKLKTRAQALEKSAAFRNYFQTIAGGKEEFIRSVTSDGCEYTSPAWFRLFLKSIWKMMKLPMKEPLTAQTSMALNDAHKD